MLWFLFAVGLAVWVGGAVTGQIMMARAEARGDNGFMVGLTREIAWIVPRVYIPAGVVGICAGLLLLFLSGVSFLSWWVLFPILVYLGIIVMGSAYSLPEYGRLNALFAQRARTTRKPTAA